MRQPARALSRPIDVSGAFTVWSAVVPLHIARLRHSCSQPDTCHQPKDIPSSPSGRRPRRARAWTVGTFRRLPVCVSAVCFACSDDPSTGRVVSSRSVAACMVTATTTSVYGTQRCQSDTYSVLALPLVSLLLDTRDLALKVFGLDVYLAKSIRLATI